MSLMSRAISPFVGGVSQVPEKLRPGYRVSAQENMWSHPTLGLIRRPPASTVGNAPVNATLPASPLFHFVDQSPTERYVVMVDGSTVKVWDANTGAAQTVLTPKGTGYLPLNSKDDLRALTVGDTTFLVNRTKVVKAGTKKAPAQKFEALIFVRQVDYATQFSVTLNGTTVSIQTIDQAHASAGSLLSTDSVALDLVTQLQANAQIQADFSFEVYGSTLYLYRADGGDFSLTTSDGLSDKGLKAIKGTAQAVEDLPSRAKAGMVVHIQGDPGSPKDDFWVVYEDTDSPDQSGVWREAAEPGSPLALDPDTMPWALVRDGILRDDLKAHAAPKAPTVHVQTRTTQTAGFTSDTDGTAYDGDTNIPIRIHGRGVLGTLGGLTGGIRTIRAGHSIDTSLLEHGEQIEVQLLANTGAGGTFEVHASRTYDAGRMHNDETLEATAAFPAGTQFKLLTNYATKATPDASRQVNLMAHRESHPTLPGLQFEVVTQRVVTFDPAAVYPPGSSVSVTANGTTVTTTVTTAGTMTAAQVASSLKASLDAQPGLVATLSGSTGIVVSNATAGEAIDVSVSASISTVTLWMPGAGFGAHALEGHTLTNLSDGGSTGQVVFNGDDWLQTTILTGGTDNLIQPGDKCSVSAGDGTFVLRPIQWAERSVGSLDSNPFPSFVGQPINEPVFYRNRLGFLSGENAVLSASGDFFRFSRRTVTDLLPDDPIDVTLAMPQAATLDRGIEWAGKLCLIAQSGIYTLTGEPALEPSTVRIEQALQAHIDTATPPVCVGTRLLVAQPAGEYARILEIFLDPYSHALVTDDVTKEVPKYVSGNPKCLTGSLGHGLLVAADSSAELYVYSFAYQTQGAAFTAPARTFAAWQRWQFAGAVYAAQIMGERLILLTIRSGQLCLDSIPVADVPESGVFQDSSGFSPASYTSTVSLTRPFPRSSDGQPVVQGRLQVRYLKVHYGAGSSLVATVTRTGSVDTKSVTLADADGVLSVPILTRNTEFDVSLSTSSTAPLSLPALEWESYFSTRSRPQ